MRVGLIDVDGSGFPNLPLMKLSAWHKQAGDDVCWYNAMEHAYGDPMDIVYMSKVFSFTPDYAYFINADKVVRSGSGYAIQRDGKQEYYCGANDPVLPDEIEHCYPDYSLYADSIPAVKNTAYGFLTRGCPRGCHFCHVQAKEGPVSRKVADLSEFWRGQKNIVLLDPNITACKDRVELFEQLVKSGAHVDFSQGLDVRMMNDELTDLLLKMKVSSVHFAWDSYADKDIVVPKLEAFRRRTGWPRQKVGVYILTNYDSTHEQDLERVYTVRDMGFRPYVMIYDKDTLPSGHITRKLQRYVNSPRIFTTVPSFEEYNAAKKGSM